MGVKNASKILKPYVKQVYCSEFQGTKMAIDFSIQLYRNIIGMKNRKQNGIRYKFHDFLDITKIDIEHKMSYEEMIAMEDDLAPIIATCAYLEKLADKTIFPVLVFDGKPPSIKRKKLDERKVVRERAIKKCEEISDKNCDEFIKNRKKSVSLKNKHYKDIHELLDAMGIPYVLSPTEADSQCVALESGNNISGVISDDSDILVYGAKKLIKGITKGAMVEEIELSNVLCGLMVASNRILYGKGKDRIVEFTHENFIDYCILHGTDYNDPFCDDDYEEDELLELFVDANLSIPTLIKNTLMKKFDIDVELEYIELFSNNQDDNQDNNQNPNVDPNIIMTNKAKRLLQFYDNWKCAKEIYTNVGVQKPAEIDVQIKMPNYDKIIELLCNKYKFKLSVANTIYEKLRQLYETSIGLNTNDQGFGSFKSYQIKFRNSNKNNKNNKNINNKKRELPRIPQISQCSQPNILISVN